MSKETITSISGCYPSSSMVQIHTDKSIYTLQSLEGLISTFAEHYKVDKTTHRSWGG